MPPEIMGLLLVVGFVLAFFALGVRIINEYERGVVLRFGRLAGLKDPGFRWIIPVVDRMFSIDLRTIVRDVPPQDVITKDNVSVKVNAVIYFRVMDSERAVLQVEDYLYATSQLTQTTLRSVLGQVELDELLAERERINSQLQEILDEHSDPWGVKVSQVEVKHVDLPHEMQRAMARQAEAERERRAKIIAAEGEFQASRKLSDAAAVIDEHPSALQLRYLQTLVEIASDSNSTTVFPVPIDLFEPFLHARRTAVLSAAGEEPDSEG